MAKLKVDPEPITLMGGTKVKLALQIERDGYLNEGEIPKYKLVELLQEAIDALGPLVTEEEIGRQMELLTPPAKPRMGWSMVWNGGVRR